MAAAITPQELGQFAAKSTQTSASSASVSWTDAVPSAVRGADVLNAYLVELRCGGGSAAFPGGCSPLVEMPALITHEVVLNLVLWTK